MDTIEKDDFTIDPKGSVVKIGDGHSADNKIELAITNTTNEASVVRVTVTVKYGNNPEALLGTHTAHVEATYNVKGVMNDMYKKSEDPETPETLLWETSSRGVQLGEKGVLSISLSRFESNTPPGDTVIQVLVKTKCEEGREWSTNTAGIVTISKTAVLTDAPKIHYFTVSPDFILNAGQDEVKVDFYATGFKSLHLFRNNHQVKNGLNKELEIKQDGSIWGTFTEKPSITSVYRLEAKITDGNDEDKTTDTRYRTVQVISPGWNQIALPQGYPARLFVNQDFNGESTERLYGIFIDNTGGAALYSSATGVDDWRPEPGKVPPHMAMSPGVAYANKLWLIGGSSVDLDNPGNEVWCYDNDDEVGERHWIQKDYKMPARAGHACVVGPCGKEGKVGVLVIGGSNNGDYCNDVWKLQGDKLVKIDQKGPSTAVSRAGHAAVIFKPANDQATEVWIYGGKNQAYLFDLWSSRDGGCTWEKKTGIDPAPGIPFGAAMMTDNTLQGATGQRLFLGGTFRDHGEQSNRSSSFIFEWQWRNEVWETRPMIDGWERFEGSRFYMQGIAFNRFLFVWSLHTAIDSALPPKLNILISR
jgi:hypothetical protein